LLISVVNNLGKDTDFLRESQTFYPLFHPQHNKTDEIHVILSDENNENISPADDHANDEPDHLG
jgi:hypothetical protein